MVTERRWATGLGSVVPGLGIVIAFWVAACSDPGEDARAIAESCGQQKCPAGTAVTEMRSISGGTDVSGSFDPSTYQAAGAYAKFGTGECQYACVVIQPCPPDSYPAITETCFRCGPLDATGMSVVAPDCQH
jgi:hypothetical protein